MNVHKGYVTSNCTIVKRSHTWIPGLYNPKTGERVYVVLDDEKLGKYGYHDKHKNAQQRHEALDKVYISMNKNWLSFILIDYRNYIKKKYSTI